MNAFLRTASFRFVSLVLLLGLLGGRAGGQGTPIGFEETFALSPDRERALERLVPGSPEHFFYTCLHLQNEGRLAQVAESLRAWRERHGTGGGLQDRIELRQALLRAEQDGERSYAYLVRVLGLHFDQRPVRPGAAQDLPTALDPNALTEEVWLREALRGHNGSLRGLGEGALVRMAARDLTDAQLREFLTRMRQTDVPGLARLVVRELGLRDSRGFGSMEVHRLLLLEQLEECLAARPELLADTNFVATYLPRLAPGADEDRDDPATRAAHLERLERFALRLPSAFDALKAHVAYHRLALDLELGTLDEGRLLTYLRLARQPAYVEPRLQRELPAVALGTEWSSGLPVVSGDEPLVREYLGRLFERLESFERFVGAVRRDYVQRIFAEAKILTGAPNPERWFALLDDARAYEELKDRVEVRFPRGLPRHFAPNETIVLEADVKNVDTLLVKVFEIDAVAFFAAQRQTEVLRDVDASIDLDGLVAHEERTYRYDDSPLLRVRRRFEFDRLERPGVYVIELIGKGLASRAVVRKGHLSHLERIGSAGHALRILDHAGDPALDASVLFGGREFVADSTGEILIPFTTSPGTRAIVLKRGELAVPSSFEHRAESYALEAALHVERETLLAGATARLVVRPRLTLADRRISLALLEEPRLELSATDLDGVVTTSSVRGLSLEDDQEFVHEFPVPPRTVAISAHLAGRVRSLSETRDVELATVPRQWPINGIDTTDEVWNPLLVQDAQGYSIELRGKNGEPGAGRAVTAMLHHRDFTTGRRFPLQTDARGRIELGRLEGIERIELHGPSAEPFSFLIAQPPRGGAPRQIHALEDRAIRVPYTLERGDPDPRRVSLIELRAGQRAFVHPAAISFAPGYLVLDGLRAGDYSLVLHETGESYEVRIVRGRRVGAHGLGAARRLELSHPFELTIAGAAVEGDELVVRLDGAGRGARVHLAAVNYVPAFDAHQGLTLEARGELDLAQVDQAENQYESGRSIGDELRYVLERRFAPRFPGNMLTRAGLLLNPWAVDEATLDSTAGEGKFGGRFGGRSARARAGSGAGPAPGRPVGGGRPQSFTTLDFLADAAVVRSNLRPDERGVVRVPLAELGRRPLLRVVAVDERVTLSRDVLLPRSEPGLRERRLTASLDPGVHRVEQRRVEVLRAGDSVTFTEATGSGVRIFDSLDDVFALFRTLGKQAELERFEFLLRWPSLDEAQKLARYSDFAGHELHVFLRKKDPVFFERVVRPYLANKAHKTFLDHWLLGADLRRYLEPWAFADLNTFERILLLRELENDPVRHVHEAVDLLPRERFALRTYFDAVLAARALERDKGGLAGALEERVMLELVEAELRDSNEHELRRAESGPSTPGPGQARVALDAPAPAGDDWFLGKGVSDLESLGYIGEPLERDAARRQTQLGFFQPMPETRELAERHYWRLPLGRMDAEWITPTPFWLDFARSVPGEPFLSSRFPLATRNLSEMLLALALLDLPFEAAEHRTASSDAGVTFTADSPLLLARKNLATTSPSGAGRPILVGQDFFRLDDPFVIENGVRRDKLVTGEFVVGVPYGARVVVTNPSSTPIEVELLLQIPQGSLPVRRGFVTRGVPISLAGYASTSFEYAFYFPRAGTYRHYPVHVGEDGALLAFAPTVELVASDARSTFDPTSWEHLSQVAELPALLAYLESANLAGLDLARLAWRMQERSTFEVLIDFLRARQRFDPTLWSFGLHHRSPREAREYLEGRPDVIASVGPWLHSPLLNVEPRERRLYEHLEYEPLINGRVHRFGPQRRIFNASFAEQYRAFLGVLAYKPRLDDLDRMALTYYLCLQDRVEEALAQFALVDPERIEARLQYDYLAAYLAFYSPEPQAAWAIAQRHAEHPVPRWRARFADVLAQLDEAEGRGPAWGGDSDDRDRRQAGLASASPSLELSVEARRVTLDYANLERVELRYRPMDIELLFSTSPFLQAGAKAFGTIQPHRVDRVALPKDRSQLVLDLPAEFAAANVLVEVRGGGLARTQAYYANDLRLQVMETYGQLGVRKASDGTPLPAVYVKVYARLADGRVRFHKDGYTDLRGRFDYVSVSGVDGAPVARYAVLVLSEAHGALVRELDPPQQ